MWKKLLVTLAVVAVLLTAVWAGLKSIPVSLLYWVETEFQELPENDDALTAWLAAQPGVIHAFVGQRKGEPNTLVVSFGMARTGWGPPFPDLEAKCRELGYRGPTGLFRDSPRNSGGISPRSPRQPR